MVVIEEPSLDEALARSVLSLNRTDGGFCLQAKVGERGNGRSSGASFPRPSGANADGAATVRNVLPWRNMEKELAIRLAAKAARSEVPPWKRAQQEPRDLLPEEAAPDSGVRSSVTDEPMRPLTYSMYTVSELEARPYQAPPPPVVQRAPSPWPDVGRSGVALARVLWSWVRASKPRPSLIELGRDPFALFVAHLRAGLKSLPWKKIGWGSAIAFGSLFLLLFALIALAELTDDVSHSGSASPSKSMMMAKAPAPAETSAVATPAPDPAGNAIELDDEPPPLKARPTPKPKSKSKKPKPPDLFNP